MKGVYEQDIRQSADLAESHADNASSRAEARRRREVRFGADSNFKRIGVCERSCGCGLTVFRSSQLTKLML